MHSSYFLMSGAVAFFLLPWPACHHRLVKFRTLPIGMIS